MRVLMAAACLGVVSGFNIMNPMTGKCIDLHAPCVGGGEEKGCEREKPEKLEKGTNLQTYACHFEDNQEWELLDNGRLRNPITELCIDIKAPCKDEDKKDDPKCERVAVGDLKDKANIQMWECHDDPVDVDKRSKSYGNQKWSITNEGALKNTGSGLCLVAVDTDKETNVKVGKCGDYKDRQYFVIVPPKFSEKAAESLMVSGNGAEDDAKPEKLFQIVGDGFLSSKGAAVSSLSATLVGSVSLAFVGAFVWLRKGRLTEQQAAE